MCGEFDQGSLAKEDCIQERPLNDPKYFPKPFLEDKFEPFEWTHILATLFICTNEITQTQFCDEDGNGIIPLCMVISCFQELPTTNLEKAVPKIEEIPLNLIHSNEISTWDKGSSEEETKPKMYDASLELEERVLAQKETKQELANSQIHNKHFKSLRRKTQTPKFKNKRNYLTKINVDDCIKDKVTGIYTISTKNTLKQEKVQQNKKH